MTTDHTYDQVIQAQAANKMAGIIAGQGTIKLTSDQIEKWQAGNPASASEITKADVAAKLLNDECHRLYTK